MTLSIGEFCILPIECVCFPKSSHAYPLRIGLQLLLDHARSALTGKCTVLAQTQEVAGQDLI
ncbi:hypothetical protein D3C81_690750 [compost metagenome]